MFTFTKIYTGYCPKWLHLAFSDSIFVRSLLVLLFNLSLSLVRCLFSSNIRNERFHTFPILHMRTARSKITFLFWYRQPAVFVNHYLYFLLVRTHWISSFLMRLSPKHAVKITIFNTSDLIIFYLLPLICRPFLRSLWRCGPTRAMTSSFLRFLDHTQRRTTVGRTPLDEWSARRRDLYLKSHNTDKKHPCPRWDSNPRSQQASGGRPTP